MKLLKAKVTSFGSYKELEFDFNDQGLALIHGATGSGKSTLQDIATWVLFGQTAKNGTVDDVVSWTSNGEPTTGILEVELNNETIEVTRIRGKGKNDLYFSGIRGKDIQETQKLLNAKLGLDYYAYVLGAYYNEFSPSGSFFTAKASDRRDLFERLSNLDFPTKLVDRIADVKKETRKTHLQVSEGLIKETGRLEQLKQSHIQNKRNVKDWDRTQETRIKSAEISSQHFEEEMENRREVVRQKRADFEATRRDNIQKLHKKLELEQGYFLKASACENCGHVSAEHQKRLEDNTQYFLSKIEQEKTQKNPFDDTTSEEKNPYFKLKNTLTDEVNPYTAQVNLISLDLENSISKVQALEQSLATISHKINSLDQLHTIADVLTQELRRNTVRILESEVNRLLQTYFDSEIKVMFYSDGADKLDVFIWKSGYECSYRQLSKGQRSLLKLCFSIACMQAMSNKCGVHFETLCLDESLDGMDTNLKLKAYRLFEELSLQHSTVLVIDHSEEIKELFTRKYYVTLDSDISNIQEMQ